MSVLGLDVGTSGCKAILLGENGSILDKSSFSYDIIIPHPGFLELDPNDVWEAVRKAIKKITAAVKDDPIKAVSISSMSDTFTPCDANNRPICNSIIGIDTRNTIEAEYFSNTLGKKWIYKITGQAVHPTYTITKILWLQKNCLEIFKQAKKFLCYEDFIASKLCGNAVFGFSMAARTMAFDINKLCWNEKILDICNISSENFAIPSQAGTITGKIRKEIAEELNLSPGVKVVVGGMDQTCAAIGCGLSEDGWGMDSTGTVEVLIAINNKPILTDRMLKANICYWPYAIEKKYCALGQILTAGAAFRWFLNNFANDEIEEAKNKKTNPYDLMISRFKCEPSDLFFIPNLSGSGTPEFSPYAKGAVYGVTLKTDKYDLAKAIIEGLCYELMINVEIFKREGLNIQALRALGGASNSNEWMQIKADITGMTIEADNNADQSPLGAAIIAAYGVGLIDNLDDTSDFVKRELRRFSPITERQRKYGINFDNYLKFRSSIYPLYEKI